MAKVKPPKLCSFVVRLWLEKGKPDTSLWHGHIRHVQSNHETHFRDLKGMSDFVEQVSGCSGPVTGTGFIVSS